VQLGALRVLRVPDQQLVDRGAHQLLCRAAAQPAQARIGEPDLAGRVEQRHAIGQDAQDVFDAIRTQRERPRVWIGGSRAALDRANPESRG
jgi:hypothetical protein